MMAFAPNVNEIMFNSDLHIQTSTAGGNIIGHNGVHIKGSSENSDYPGALLLSPSHASLSLINTTSSYILTPNFVLAQSDHVVSSGIKHEVYEQIISSSASYNPSKSLLRLWHSSSMTIVFANLPTNPTGRNTAAIFTVFNPSSVTHSVNGVNIAPNQSRQFMYDYSASKWITSY
jgi:hypothetical protein